MRPQPRAVIRLTRDVIRCQGQTRASLAAAGAALWLVIAIFPAATAAVSLFGLVVHPTDVAGAIEGLSDWGQGTLASATREQLEQVAASAPSSLSIGLAVSVLVSLWSASNGSYNLVRAIRLSFGVPAEPYVIARARSFVGALLGVVGLGIVAFVTSALAEARAGLTGVWYWLATVGSALVAAAIATILLLALYRYSLRSAAKYGALIPGAVFSTLALGALAFVLAVVVRHLGKSAIVYGVAAGSVSALLSVYVAAYIVLLGAVINSSWPNAKARGPSRTERPRAFAD